MKVWKCDRCEKVYDNNKNEILKEINKPIFNCIQEDWNACYIKFYNKSLDIETDSSIKGKTILALTVKCILTST